MAYSANGVATFATESVQRVQTICVAFSLFKTLDIGRLRQVKVHWITWHLHPYYVFSFYLREFHCFWQPFSTITPRLAYNKFYLNLTGFFFSIYTVIKNLYAPFTHMWPQRELPAIASLNSYIKLLVIAYFCARCVQAAGSSE